MYAGNGTLQYSDNFEYIHSRGNASWDFFPKKSYAFKLTHNAALTGEDATDKWILLSNASDNSNLRNKLAFDIGSSWPQFCLFFNLY